VFRGAERRIKEKKNQTMISVKVGEWQQVKSKRAENERRKQLRKEAAASAARDRLANASVIEHDRPVQASRSPAPAVDAVDAVDAIDAIGAEEDKEEENPIKYFNAATVLRSQSMRKSKGWSQEMQAQHCNVSLSDLKLFERGQLKYNAAFDQRIQSFLQKESQKEKKKAAL
jgi:ribosome-binding protein aMBF1 (putative translation factor)